MRKIGFTISRKMGSSSVLFLLSILIMSLQACKKKESAVGRDVIPQGIALNLKKTDTITINFHQVIRDSIITSSRGQALLGIIDNNDYGDNLGKLKCRLFHALQPQSMPTDFPDQSEITVDSVFIDLLFDSGDKAYRYGSDNLWKLGVFEINDDSQDSVFYGKDSLLIDRSVNLFDNNMSGFIIIQQDTMIYGAGDTIGPALHIPLKNSLGQHILDGYWDNSWSNGSDFLSFFRGLCFDPDLAPAKGVIHRLNMTSTNSKLRIYYHTNSEPTEAKYVYLTRHLSGKTFTQINKMYDNTDVGDLLNDYTRSEQEFYMQYQTGLKLIAHIPYSDFFHPDRNITINRVSLEMPVKNSNLEPIDEIFVYGLPKDDSLTTIDEYETSSKYLTEQYDADKEMFSFRLTSFFNKMKHDGDTTSRLLLVPPVDFIVNRSLFYGTGVSNATRSKLIVTYTEE